MLEIALSILILIARGIKKIGVVFEWFYSFFNRANEIKRAVLFPSGIELRLFHKDNLTPFEMMNYLPEEIKAKNEGIILTIKTYEGIRYLFFAFNHDYEEKTTPCQLIFNVSPYNREYELLPSGFTDWFSNNKLLNDTLQHICSSHLVMINQKPHWCPGFCSSWIKAIDDNFTLNIFSLQEDKVININEKKIIKEL